MLLIEIIILFDTQKEIPWEHSFGKKIKFHSCLIRNISIRQRVYFKFRNTNENNNVY